MAGPEAKPWERFLDFLAESTRIFKAFSMALDAKKLVVSFAAVIVWMVGAMLINVIPVTAVLIGLGLVGTALALLIFAKTEMELTQKNLIVALVGSIVAVWVIVAALIYALHNNVLVPLYGLQPLWAIIIASVFGTAVSRIAAVNAATDETVGFREAVRFTLKKLSSSIWTLLVPPIAVIAYVIILTVVGLPGRIPALGVVWYAIIGILYIVFLLVGLFFATVLLIYAPSLLLFQPAIAAEGTDSFDAISRAYSMVFSRPWRLGYYAILAYIYGRIIMLVAAYPVIWAGEIASRGLSFGIGEKMTENVAKLDLSAIIGAPFQIFAPGPVQNALAYIVTGNVSSSFEGVGIGGGWFVVFWQYILLAIYLAFAVSLGYCLITQIYFLMRKAEGTPFEEVYIETAEEEEFAGEFAEEAKPAAFNKTAADETAKKAAKEKAKGDAEKNKPIDLAGKDRPIDQDDVGQ